MKEAITFFIYFVSTILKIMRPGGIKSIIAENLAMKQQLIIMKRKSKILRSPPLTPFQRIFFSFLSFFMSEDQVKQIAVIISPSTIFRFHQLLINRKYRMLFSSNKNRKKPGPKGPPKEIIDVVLEMKKRNPRMGCPKIALTISKIFGIEIDKDIVRRILKKILSPESIRSRRAIMVNVLGTCQG